MSTCECRITTFARELIILNVGQAWRIVHPPKRGRFLLASTPLVHRGFFLTWTANDLNRHVSTLLPVIIHSIKRLP